MDTETIGNHKQYLQRLSFYRGFGYDLEGERDFIFNKSLPFLGDILEIGTGKGHFALTLAKHGFNFTSIDISKEEQEIAKLNLRYFGLEKQAVFQIDNAENLDFPDKSFDTIFSINVFHHLKRPIVVLDEIIRLLRPSGKVVLGDFSEKGLEIINMCHARECKKHDFFGYRLEKAKDYFLNNNFTVNEFKSHTQEVIIALA